MLTYIRRFEELLQSLGMPGCQIHDMNIISNLHHETYIQYLVIMRSSVRAYHENKSKQVKSNML